MNYKKARRKRHNNRKLTKARRGLRHALGGRRGYVPNHIRHNYRMLEMYRNKLARLNKDVDNRLENSSNILRLEHRVRAYEAKIREYNSL